MKNELISMEDLQIWNTKTGYAHDFNGGDYFIYQELMEDYFNSEQGKIKLGDLVLCESAETNKITSEIGRVCYKREGGKYGICHKPYTPFLFADGRLDISGGYFFSAMENEFKRVGKKKVMFKAWGRYGMGANGCFYFPVLVNQWLVKNENIY